MNKSDQNKRIQDLETALAFERAALTAEKKSRNELAAAFVKSADEVDRLENELRRFRKVVGRLYWRRKA